MIYEVHHYSIWIIQIRVNNEWRINDEFCGIDRSGISSHIYLTEREATEKLERLSETFPDVHLRVAHYEKTGGAYVLPEKEKSN